MKLQLAGISGSTDDLYQNKLQNSEPNRDTPSNRTERGGQMKREAAYEELEQMSLESLLYYVLVGDGRAVKKAARM